MFRYVPPMAVAVAAPVGSQVIPVCGRCRWARRGRLASYGLTFNPAAVARSFWPVSKV